MPKSHYEQGQSPQPRSRRRLGLEILEDRTVLSTASPVVSLQGLSVSENYDPKTVLVQFRAGTTPHAEQGTTLGPAVSATTNLYQIDLQTGVTVTAALKLFQADSTVLKAEPNYLLGVSSVPNDTLLGQQWALQNTANPAASIHAEQAWDVTQGSPSVIVAVDDTGIDYTNQDLYANIWINQAEIPTSRLKNLVDVYHDGYISMRDLNNPINQGPGKIEDLNHNGYIDGADLLTPMVSNAQGQDTGLGGWACGSDKDGSGYIDDIIGWNFFANNNNPADDMGHGTNVAGIIGATGNNNVGVAGIDWNVQLMPIKFLGAGGTGTIAQFIEGLNFAVAHGAQISNNSWSGAAESSILTAAIANAQSHGDIFVAAAGNNGTNNDTSPAYPSSVPLDNVVAVAATDQNNNLASFSDYGARSVQLGAPGVDILSTMPGNTYSTLSGTSQATPQVTGVLALVWGLHPTWTYKQVIDQVLNTVVKIPSLEGKTTTGGLLDAAAAVAVASVASTPPMHVVDTSGKGPTAYSLNQITIQFDQSVSVSTLVASAVSLVGPGGRVVAITGISATAGSGDRIFVLSFATQTITGSYALRIGTSVKDQSGASLVAFSSSFYVQSAPVTTPVPLHVVSAVGSGPTAYSMNQITVRFDQAVSVSTLAASAVSLVGPGGRVVAITGISAVAGSGNLAFVLSFATQTTAGSYALHIGTTVKDQAGASLVAYSTTLTVRSSQPTPTPMHIVDTAGKGPTAYSLNQITVRFDQAVSVSTLVASAVSLVGPGGRVVAITGISATAGSGDRIFVLSFATQTITGSYALRIGASVKDQSGASLVAFSTSFYVQSAPVTTPTPLHVVSAVGSGPTAYSMNQITVRFDQAVSPSTLAASAVSLVGPGGRVVAITGISAVAGSGNLAFVLSFATQTTAGSYALHIGTTVKDQAGASLVAYSTTLTVRSSQPTPTPMHIVDTSGKGPTAYSLNQITVRFDQAVSPSTLAASAVSLVGPGGRVVAITGIGAVAGSGNRIFVLSFATQTITGSYALRIGASVKDQSGASLVAYSTSFYVQSAPVTTPPASSGVYTSSAHVNVPKGGRGVSVISVAANTTIRTIKVEINLTHPDMGDLFIHVQAPDGTDIVLANRKGGPTSNMIDTVFDDNARTYIGLGQGPFTGSYQPDAQLANLAGKSTQGVWKLWIEDLVGSSQGTLNSWSIIVN